MVRGMRECPGTPDLLSCKPQCSGCWGLRPAILMLCVAGTLEPPVVMPGQEATLFRLEIVDDSEPLVDEDVAGIGQGFQLLVQDIMEEVEVVGDEEQQKGSSQELKRKRWRSRARKGPGARLSFWGKMCCRYWPP